MGEAEGEDEDAEEDEEEDQEEDEEEDEEAGDADQEEGGLEQHFHVQAPRKSEYVSWDLAELAQHLLKKEEASRRTHQQEQEEARAAMKELQGQEAEEEQEGPEDDDPEAFRGTSTGLWWGSFEDGDALLDLCAKLLLHLVFKAQSETGGIYDEKGQPGSILTFLPGWAEIKAVMERLQHAPQAAALWVLPLHSTLAKEDQQKIFQHPPEGKTKIILSTNIAESSVTIDDVLVVVDAGLMRELSYDPVRRLSTLETVWVSQSSSIQRKGRAGRVRNGRCYRLFSRAQFEATPWRTAPEMQRCELSATCLQALAMQREVRDFLARAPDPPSLASVESALRELVQLGAIAPAPRGSAVQETAGMVQLRERMLPLGETLSRMPLSPCLGRMLILGVLFQCVDTACLLAAVLSAARRPFVCPPGKRKESLAYQRGFDPTSDLLACFVAAEIYEQKLVDQRGTGYGEEERADRFALERFLVPQRLRQLLRSRDSLKEELVRARLIDRHAAHRKYHHEEEFDDGDAGGWGAWEEEGPDHHHSHKPWYGGEWNGYDDYEWAALHRHEGEKEMRKALLVAAAPMNLAMRRRPFLAKHRTPTGLDAIVAPQSVNAQQRAGPGKEFDRRGGPSWWAYGSMQISNKQGFLRTTTLVDPYHVVLFGGLSVEHQGGRAQDQPEQSLEDDEQALEGLDGGGPVALIDEWIELQGSDETVRQLSYLRDEIRRCIHLKVLAPGEPLPEASQWLLDEVATNVLRSATRRQNRTVSLLPQQPIMPPGGSVPAPTHSPHSAAKGGWGQTGWREDPSLAKGKGKGKGKASGGKRGKGSAKGSPKKEPEGEWRSYQ